MNHLHPAENPDSHSKSRLWLLLSQVRKRLWLIDGARAACWGLCAALAALLIGMWFDLVWELPAAFRASAWVCAFIALLAVLARLLIRTWRNSGQLPMARRIDAAAGCGGELLNGFELAAPDGNLSAAQRAPNLTTGLATLTVERAAEMADRVPPATVISRRPAVVATCWLAALLGALVILSIACPLLAATQWLRFSSPWSDTPPYSPFRFTVEPGHTEVRYGQGLDVRVKVDGPLTRDVQLVVVTGDRTEKVPMFPETNGAWRASLSRLTADATYLARVERARSSSYRIHVVTTPTIEEVKFLVTPPAYTHDAPVEGPLPKNGLTGLAGTKVRVTARSNRPLTSGEIHWNADNNLEPLILRPAQPGDLVVIGEFTITRADKFELHVTDTDKQTSQDPFNGSISLLTDQRPVVRILEPKPMSLATPTSLLPVVIDAEDDYGLARVELYRSLNDSRPMSTDLPLSRPSLRRFRDQHYLPLARYALEAGDEIKLFARVTDNDPAAGKGTESSVVTVRIISQADFEKMVRQREGLQVLVSKYQQAERRLEKLSEEIAALQKELEQAPEDSPLAEALRQKLEKLAQELKAESEAIAHAAEHELPYDVDKNLKQRLTDLAEELAQRGEDIKQLAQDAKNKKAVNNEAVRRQLAKLAEKLKEKKQQFGEQATDPLDVLAKVYPLMEDQARFTALVLWQKDLAERLATYKDAARTDDPAAKARLRDLQDEQRRAHEELVQLLDDIENHAQQLPEGDPFDKLRQSAIKFAAEVRASGAGEAMSSAETSLTDFRGADAYRHAKDAATILESFLKKCSGMGEQGGQCLVFNPTLGECLGDSVEQLLADAGLSMGGKPGSGPGQGQGRGGYSARTGNRVGLYGGLQALGGAANQGRGFGTTGSTTSGRNQAGGAHGDPSSITEPWVQSSSGAGTSPLPPQFRRRVNLYFQRVADDLEAAGK